MKSHSSSHPTIFCHIKHVLCLGEYSTKLKRCPFFIVLLFLQAQGIEGNLKLSHPPSNNMAMIVVTKPPKFHCPTLMSSFIINSFLSMPCWIGYYFSIVLLPFFLGNHCGKSRLLGAPYTSSLLGCQLNSIRPAHHSSFLVFHVWLVHAILISFDGIELADLVPSLKE